MKIVQFVAIFATVISATANPPGTPGSAHRPGKGTPGAPPGFPLNGAPPTQRPSLQMAQVPPPTVANPGLTTNPGTLVGPTAPTLPLSQLATGVAAVVPASDPVNPAGWFEDDIPYTYSHAMEGEPVFMTIWKRFLAQEHVKNALLHDGILDEYLFQLFGFFANEEEFVDMANENLKRIISHRMHKAEKLMNKALAEKKAAFLTSPGIVGLPPEDIEDLWAQTAAVWTRIWKEALSVAKKAYRKDCREEWSKNYRKRFRGISTACAAAVAAAIAAAPASKPKKTKKSKRGKRKRSNGDDEDYTPSGDTDDEWEDDDDDVDMQDFGEDGGGKLPAK